MKGKIVSVITLIVLAGTLITVAPAATPNNAFSRAQATEVARDYIRTAAFSRLGLIHQLRYEGFSLYDATWGTDHIRANWYKQALRSGREYLRSSHFSKSGLYRQLVYEKFTRAQAAYAVNIIYG